MIKVAFIVDESGSMCWLRDKVVSLINEQHKVLSQNVSDVYYYKFNTDVKKIRNLDSRELVDFTLVDYNPDGGTALYDAVIKSFEEITENDRYDDKYLFIIISDGEENSSKQPYSALKEILNSNLAKERCTFTYLGGTKNLSDLAISQYNIRPCNTGVFKKNLMDNSIDITRGINNYFCAISTGANSVDNFYEGSVDGN